MSQCLMPVSQSGKVQPVRVSPTELDGLLGVPAAAHALILLSHGSGSGRSSPRNAFVATQLREAGFATLVLDLLTEPEAGDRRNVFDVELLATRLEAAADWVSVHPSLRHLPRGFFGASTGAAAALVAAARQAGRIGALVSCGGRPDMAAGWLARVDCPTLLIGGELDREVMSLNETALEILTCEKELRIVPDAANLFAEPGALQIVIRYACDWFSQHLGRAPR